MGDAEKRVVWVLGAGFSAALGGPLLPKLLSHVSRLDVDARYPEAEFRLLHTMDASLVRGLYTSDHGAWRDAEDFIDYLDTAAEERPDGAPNPHRARLVQLARSVQPPRDVNLQDVRLAARRLVAAECAGFLEGVDPDREQWQPFKTWAQSLTGSDTVITFNYDRVLEMISDAADREAQRFSIPNGGSKLKILLPGQMDDPILWRGCAPVLKLHGSVDWKKVTINKGRPDERSVVQKDRPNFALDCGPAELAIATPGPSKRREAQGPFRELWKLARRALVDANAIVFVGYRFPETDADAREQLLTAIAENGWPSRPSRSKHLSLHVVLGKDRESTERLASLLRFVCKRDRDEAPMETNRSHSTGREHRFTIDTQPLFAQDFFTVFRREDL